MRGAHIKAEKRKQAEERNNFWAALSPKQQIAALRQRRGNSAKQIKRIQAAVKGAKNA